MQLHKPLTNRHLVEGLSHVHVLAPVSFAERRGDELGPEFHDHARPAVNRFLDFLRSGAPDEPCRIELEAGSGVVVAALLQPAGVLVLLDTDQAGPAQG